MRLARCITLLLALLLAARVGQAQFRPEASVGARRAVVPATLPDAVPTPAASRPGRCHGIRVRRMVAGVAIGAGVGAAAGRVSGTVDNIWQEDEALAQRVARRHRIGGVVLGATFGILLGRLLVCSSEGTRAAAGQPDR